MVGKRRKKQVLGAVLGFLATLAGVLLGVSPEVLPPVDL